jgi:hypothetical protein
MLAGMKIRPNMMRFLAVAMLATGVFCGGCGRRVQRNPSLTQAYNAPPPPAEKGFLQKAGDTTWHVVSTPARWVSPKKPAEPEEPEVYEPPGLIIVRPGGMMAPPAGVAASQPADVRSH